MKTQIEKKLPAMGDRMEETEKLIKKLAFGFEFYPENISQDSNNPKIKKTSKRSCFKAHSFRYT